MCVTWPLIYLVLMVKSRMLCLLGQHSINQAPSSAIRKTSLNSASNRQLLPVAHACHPSTLEVKTGGLPQFGASLSYILSSKPVWATKSLSSHIHTQRGVGREGRRGRGRRKGRKEKIIENVTIVICSKFRKSPLKVFKPNPANVTRKKATLVWNTSWPWEEDLWLL